MASLPSGSPPPLSPDPPDPSPPSPPRLPSSSPPSNSASPLQASGSIPVRSPRDLTAELLQKSSIPAGIPSAVTPTFAERFKASLRNLRKISSPTFLEDGTPVVQAPESVFLSTAELWKDHIVAHFHGSIPPAKKILDDLNPVWGKFGKITVRVTSETSCLIFIPSVQTREWVLQVGYWQAGHCAFSVYLWSPDGNLAPQDLETALTWVILRNVPPQLYSFDGISVIASGIGEPLHTEKSRLDPYNFGNTKIKVEIDLHGTLPAEVEVRDAAGFSVRVQAEYPSLPPKCCNCGRFGHYLNRCLMPPQKRIHATGSAHTTISSKVALVNSKIPLSESEDNPKAQSPTSNSIDPGRSKTTPHRKKSHSRSRGRKEPQNKGTLISKKSQNHVSEQLWVPVGNEQHSPSVPVEVQTEQESSKLVAVDVKSNASSELEQNDRIPVVPSPLAAVSNNGDPSEPEPDLLGNPWQVMQSKKKKRAQLQEALWRSPSASTSKALRFRAQAQAAVALGRRL